LTGAEARPDAVPVLEESIRIEKAVRETDRVLINTTVRERTEFVDLDLLVGDALLERVSINEVVEKAPAVRQEGDTVIIPVLEEVLVVEKRLVLKEEIRIRRREVIEHVHEPVQLRSEEVSLARAAVDNSSKIEDEP